MKQTELRQAPKDVYYKSLLWRASRQTRVKLLILSLPLPLHLNAELPQRLVTWTSFNMTPEWSANKTAVCAEPSRTLLGVGSLHCEAAAGSLVFTNDTFL